MYQEILSNVSPSGYSLPKLHVYYIAIRIIHSFVPTSNCAYTHNTPSSIILCSTQPHLPKSIFKKHEECAPFHSWLPFCGNHHKQPVSEKSRSTPPPMNNIEWPFKHHRSYQAILPMRGNEWYDKTPLELSWYPVPKASMLPLTHAGGLLII